MRPWWVLAAGTLAVTLCGPSASAQGVSAEAQARFNEGVKAYEQRDFERARVLFLQSLALVPRGSVYRNLGLAEMELGRPVDALHHLRAALAQPDLDAKRRTTTEADVRDAYAVTGHISVETAEGATLVVDGAAVPGRAPFADPVDVMPGKHAIDASLGAAKAHAEVDVGPGLVVSARLALEEGAVEPGTQAGAVPAAGSLAGAVRPADASPPPKEAFWNTRREFGAGFAVAGTVSLVVGVYFYAQASNAQDRANAARAGLSPWACNGPAQPAACVMANDAWSTQSTDATLNYAFLGLGVATLAAGAAMLLWPDSSSGPSVALAPVVTSRGGGLHLRAGF